MSRTYSEPFRNKGDQLWKKATWGIEKNKQQVGGKGGESRGEERGEKKKGANCRN